MQPLSVFLLSKKPTPGPSDRLPNPGCHVCTVPARTDGLLPALVAMLGDAEGILQPLAGRRVSQTQWTDWQDDGLSFGSP